MTSYAIAKRYNEIYLKAIWEQYEISSLAIRYFNVYGPKQDNRMVIPRFFYQAKKIYQSLSMEMVSKQEISHILMMQ